MPQYVYLVNARPTFDEAQAKFLLSLPAAETNLEQLKKSKVGAKTADLVSISTIESLKSVGSPVFTITGDNGNECKKILVNNLST